MKGLRVKGLDKNEMGERRISTNTNIISLA